MKNRIDFLGIIAIIVIIGIVLAACGGGGGLNGTFVDASGDVSVTFSGDKITIKNPAEETTGTFKIEDGKIVTTDDRGRTSSVNYTLDGNKLTFMGMTFTKK
jgi:hypothetical protein